MTEKIFQYQVVSPGTIRFKCIKQLVSETSRNPHTMNLGALQIIDKKDATISETAELIKH